jgi:hypothetical protein
MFSALLATPESMEEARRFGELALCEPGAVSQVKKSPARKTFRDSCWRWQMDVKNARVDPTLLRRTNSPSE